MAEATEASQIDAAEADAPQESPEAIPAAPPARKPRRHTTRSAGKLVETAVTAGQESDVPQEGASAVEVPEAPAEAEPPQPTPRRRRTTRRKSETVDALAEAAQPQDEAASAGEPVPAVPEALNAPAELTAEQEASPEAGTGARKRRTRGGRRRTARSRTTPEGVSAEATTQAPPEEETAEPEATPAQPLQREPARRSRRGRRAVAEEEEPGVGARVAVRHGLPEIVVNGQTLAPALFFGSLSGARQVQVVADEIRRAARAGVHIHSTLLELVCPIPPDETVYEQVDERLRAILDADSGAYVIPRLVFVPAPGWAQQYPSEVTRYPGEASDDPSIASSVFWGEAQHALQALIHHISHTTYGERVIGFHLERGEWFHPADAGYDRSFANREAFRQWLRARYRNSEVALRAAWYDGAVQFYTVEIPEAQRKPQPDIAFFEPRKERRWIDFIEFTSETVADRLIELARIVKEASGNRCLVSVCYGYTFEFGHTHSGHLALSKLLASPAIDIIAGPPSYRDREPGGAGTIPSPVDSPAVHGKLWISEDDTKTHLAAPAASEDDFNPRMRSRDATEQVHMRAAGQALAHQTGIGWMDLWGDGWLNADDVWHIPARFSEIYEASAKHRQNASPDVAVLIDERSLAHLQRGEAFVRRILQTQRDVLLKSGASVGLYLQSDVLARAFPTDAKLYIFLTPYRLPSDQRAAIREKLHNGGKTLVWLYAPGFCDDRVAAEDGASDPVGITLRQQAWNAEVGSRFVTTGHPLAENLQNHTIGVRERLNPSFYVVEEDGVTVIAEYLQTGLPSIAVREYSRWRSVFCGEPELSAELIRNLCRWAGVHLYAAGGDAYVYAGHNWLAVHAIREGDRTISLPPGLDLYDVGARALVAEGTSDYRVHLPSHATRLYYVGHREDMVKIGLPSVEPLRGKRRSVHPVPAPAPALEELAAPTEEEIAVGDVIDTDGLHEMVRESIADAVADTAEMQQISEPQEAVVKRRRRRRGGRGRGRRGGRPADGAAPVSEDAAAPDEG